MLPDPHQAEFHVPHGGYGHMLESRAVQIAILKSAKFSVMVADIEGIIQLFNVGAERMLGYSSAEVVNKVHLVDFHDPEEVMARTRALTREFSTAIASGFETLIFKAFPGLRRITGTFTPKRRGKH